MGRSTHGDTRIVEMDVDTAQSGDNLEITEPLDGSTDFLERVKKGYQLDAWFNSQDNVSRLTKIDGLYWKIGQDGSRVLAVPEYDNLRAECIAASHDSIYAGHFGRTKTIKLVARSYWWPNQNKQVEEWIQTCDACQRNKSSNQKPAGKLKPLPIPGRRWESISTDLISPLPKTADKNDAIVVFVDRLSKMVRFAACKTTDGAKELADLFVQNVFASHGLPRTLITDRDSRFTSTFWKELCKLLDMKQGLSTAYHPETDGQTERANRVLEEVLRHYVSPHQDNWDKLLPLAEFAVNNAWQESVHSTPFYLNYGQHPLTPTSITTDTRVPGALEYSMGIQAHVSKARELLLAAQQRQKQYADQRRSQEEVFTIGQKVLLSTKHLPLKGPAERKKLKPRWVGPFEIKQRINEVAYKLSLPRNMRIHDVFHVSLLKRYRSDGTRQPPPPAPYEVDGDLYYTVEAILDFRERKRGNRAHKEYLIKWQGYGHEHNTWEPERNLNCLELINEYWAAQHRHANKRKTRDASRSNSQPRDTMP